MWGDDDRTPRPGTRSTEHDAVRPLGAPPRYRRVSLQRPPRTAWERLAAWFGARYFDVQAEPIEDDATTPGFDPGTPHDRSDV